MKFVETPIRDACRVHLEQQGENIRMSPAIHLK